MLVAFAEVAEEAHPDWSSQLGPLRLLYMLCRASLWSAWQEASQAPTAKSSTYAPITPEVQAVCSSKSLTDQRKKAYAETHIAGHGSFSCKGSDGTCQARMAKRPFTRACVSRHQILGLGVPVPDFSRGAREASPLNTTQSASVH